MTLLDIIRMADRDGANIADGEVFVRLADGRKITLLDVYVDGQENIGLLELGKEE